MQWMAPCIWENNLSTSSKGNGVSSSEACCSTSGCLLANFPMMPLIASEVRWSHSGCSSQWWNSARWSWIKCIERNKIWSPSRNCFDKWISSTSVNFSHWWRSTCYWKKVIVVSPCMIVFPVACWPPPVTKIDACTWDPFIKTVPAWWSNFIPLNAFNSN